MVDEWVILHKYENVSKTANGLGGVFQSLRVTWVGRDGKQAMVSTVCVAFAVGKEFKQKCSCLLRKNLPA